MADETFYSVLLAPLGNAAILHHRHRIEDQTLTGRIGASVNFALLTSVPVLSHMLSVDGGIALPGVV